MKSDCIEHLHLHLQSQRAAYLREPFPGLEQRLDRLRRLGELVAEHGEAFVDLAERLFLDRQVSLIQRVGGPLRFCQFDAHPAAQRHQRHPGLRATG